MTLIDPAIADWITVRPRARRDELPYWELYQIDYRAPGDANIYIHFEAESPKRNVQRADVSATVGGLDFHASRLRDEHIVPVCGVGVWQAWTDDAVLLYSQCDGDKAGRADAPMSGDSSFDPKRGERGVYVIHPEEAGDEARGFGLPLKQHVSFDLWYRRVVKDPPPVGVRDAALRAVLLSAAEALAEALRLQGVD